MILRSENGTFYMFDFTMTGMITTLKKRENTINKHKNYWTD